MKITNAIVWDHRGRTDKGGKGQLEIRLTVNRKSYYIGTGIRVHKSEFLAGQVVNCHGAKELNERLSIIYSKVLAFVNEAISDGREIDIEEIRRHVWRTNEAMSDEPTLIDWIERQVPLLGVSDGTKKHYYPLIRRLVEYGKMMRWQDVTVENVVMWDAWLHQLTKPISDARMMAGVQTERISDGGIYNYHKCLKALLNRALAFGLIDANPYDRLKGKFKRGDRASVEYLTENEMQRIMTVILPQGSMLDIVHDLFIFQMYTGLPYADMQAFDGGDYKQMDGVWRRVGERIKTGVPYVSQLLPPAVAVLDKYGWQIPQVSNAEYNRQLKILGQLAGIKTRLHSHLARHTFATWMLAHGVPIEHVSKMLGHTNITQTQRYAKVQPQHIYDDYNRITKVLKFRTTDSAESKTKQA